MRPDLLLPFLLETPNLRGRVVTLGQTLDDILTPHGYPDLVSRQLGETVLLATLFAGMIKYDGIFTLQIQGDGPVRMMVADVTSAGDVRACATFDPDRLPADETPASRSIPALCGKGYMAFTVDQGAHADRYQGLVALEDDSLAACAQNYFTRSEQIDTGITLAVEGNADKGWTGGAIMLQRLPDPAAPRPGEGPAASPEIEDWRRCMILLGSCRDEELTDPALPAPDLIYRLFHEETIRVYEPKLLRRGCRCSEDKLRGILQTLPAEDRDHLAQEERIEMRCEFCEKRFEFSPADLAQA